MPLTVEQFTQRLTSSGVMSEDDLRSWIASVPVEQRPKDGELLARELVKQKRLTKFQAEQIYAGKEKSLTLGNYVILDKLGQGGMGVVLKAQHKRMARVVALKVMSPTAVKSADAVKRFHREVQTAAKLTHSNIVTAFDADEAKGTHFLVMEYVEGDDLSQLVKKHGPMSVEQAIECIIQAARGLTHAHAEGVIHRDIKPANLLLDKHGTVKILDMGLARLESGLSDAGGIAASGLTQSGTIMGTVDYMSPEQAEDTRHADARADIYALGCSLYYLLTGHAVYGGETMMKKLLAHRESPIPDLSGEWGVRSGEQHHREVCSTPHSSLATLNSVFHKMIAKKPADRYQSMTEVIADLERCRAGQSVTMNVNAVSGESGSQFELQKFLRQISGGEEGQSTSATTGPVGTNALPVSGTAETMLLTSNSAGTDPQTEMTLADGRPVAGGFVAELVRVRSFGAAVRILTNSASGRLLASVGVVLLLLGSLWLFRTPRGAMKVEITDEQIEVTFGETGRSLRGTTDETVRLPIGEHVLHVTLGETTLDTPEIAIAKGEPVEIKVEKVGNRVRVMRGKEFLVAKELPRSKNGGSKGGSAEPTADVVPQFALEFDGQASYVGLPNIGLSTVKPFTAEAWVRPSKLTDPADGAIVVGSGLLLSRTAKGAWYFHVNGMKGDISSDTEAVVGEWVHLAAVWDGSSRALYVDGRRQQATGKKATGKKATDSPPRETTTELSLGGSPRFGRAAGEKFLSGQMREVRISSVARYQSDFQPAQRFAPDKNTLGLYHFDEGTGETLKDSSSNNHHGKIVAAKWVRIGETLVSNKVEESGLLFDFNSTVTVPSLKMGRSVPLCIEAFVQPMKILERHYTTMILGFPGELSLIHNNPNPVRIKTIFYTDKSDFHASTAEPIELGKRVHLAAVREEGRLRLFLDGKLIGSTLFSAESQADRNAVFAMGNAFQGIIDEVRVSKSHRYDKPFTPEARFTSDKDTVALYHFDEGSGDVLKDSSGNGHHGKIVGAKWVKVDRGSEISNFKSQISNLSSPYDLWTSPDYEWTAPENLGPVVNSSGEEWSPCLSADGLTLLVESSRAGGQGFSDLWMCRRPTVTAPWSAPENLGPNVNSNASDAQPSLSADGLTLAFASDHGVAPNELHLWMCTRATTADPWSPRQKLQATLDVAGVIDRGPELSADGLSLYFNSRRQPGLGENDLWWCRRRTRTASWEMPENLGPTVNSDKDDGDPAVSSDGRVLVFTSNRPDGKSRSLWWSSRPSLDAPWSEAQKISRPIDGGFENSAPALSSDGQTLIFFTYNRTGGQGKHDLWQTRRVLTPAAAARAAAANTFTNTLGMEFVRVPKGKSWLGGGGGKPGTQAVEFQEDFYLGKFEVTQEGWTKVMGKNPSAYSRTGSNKELVKGFSDDVLRRYPAENVSWEAAQEFIRLLNEKAPEPGWTYRLPKQVEWEFACRGGPMNDPAESTFDFYLAKPANELLAGQANFGKLYNRPTGVGSHAPNRLGLHDMHGNVWEWCHDPSNDTYSTRGGGFINDPASMRTWIRRTIPGNQSHPDVGLRVARVPVGNATSFTNTLGMEFVRVPKGKSWLGGGGGKPGTQAVEFQEDFYLGKFEVTQGEWEVVMDGSKPSYFLPGAAGGELVKGMTDAERKRLPVESVSWEHCQEFLRRLNNKAKDTGWQYRLPTADEWEYAARGGPLPKPEESAFHFYFDQPTNTLTADQATVKASQPRRPRPVGSYSPNRLGLFDMHGNVREWGLTEHPSALGKRSVRSGGWSTDAPDCRASRDHSEPPTARHFDLGLRVARVPIAGQWQPLFNGKDLTGWKQLNLKDTGKAEVVVDEGQPAVRLSAPYGIHSPVKTRDFHLRLDFKAEQGTKGGVNLFRSIGIGVQARLDALTRSTPALVFHSYGATCQEAEFRNGQFRPVGQTGGKDASIDFTKLNLNTQSPWQRIEALRLGDSMLFLVNGQLAGAVTNLRDAREPEAKALDHSPISLWSDGNGSALFRNIELREINALPPEVLNQNAAAWLPLFNGKDLTGWVGNLERFSIVDGELRPQGAATSELLNTQRSFGDFTLKAQVWGGGNSGIRLRSATTHLTMEIQPTVDANGTFHMGRFDTPDQRSRVPTGKSFRPREWCDLELTRRGTSVSLMLNGEPFNAADPSQLPELAQLTGPVVIGLEANAGTIGFRDLRVLEHSPAPEVSWQPLFNGKDLTGLKQRAANGIAEVVVEDGQPILRLQDKSNLTTRRFGDYHLRLEFRPEKGSKVRPFSDSVSAQLMVDLGDNLTKANLNGTELTYEAATISSGRFVGSGQTIDSKLHPYPDPLGRLTFTNATPNPNTPWQRLEILRLGDSCAVLLNGLLVAAATNIGINRPGEPPKPPGQTELGLTAYGGPASYRNIEIREITSLPREIAP